jgi:hypothetical protein
MPSRIVDLVTARFHLSPFTIPPYMPVLRALHANHSPSLDRLASMFSSWGLGFLKGEVVWGEGRHLDAAGRQLFSMFSDKKIVGVGTMQGPNLHVQTIKC